MTALLISLLATFAVALILERSDQISRAIIRSATRCLPAEERSDRESQYLSDSDAVEGSAWTLLNALGCLWLCRSAVLRQLGKSITKSVERLTQGKSNKSGEHDPPRQRAIARVKVELGPQATFLIEGLDLPPNKTQLLQQVIRKELAKNPSIMDGPRSIELTESGPTETVTFELLLPEGTGERE